MSFTRIKSGTGHRYADDGQNVPSVTGIMRDGMPKPGLIGLGGKQAAAYVMDHWDELLAMTPSQRHKAISAAQYAASSRAMGRGTDIHTHAEALAKTGEADVPDELLGPVRAYAHWLTQWHVNVLHVERPVINREWRYAGTFDLIAELGGQLWLLDIKSGQDVWPDVALQLVAYGHAEAMLDAEQREVPMPLVDRYGVVHVMPDACELVPIDVSEQTWRTWCHIRHVASYMQAVKLSSPVGAALRPNGVPLSRVRIERLDA